MFVMSSARLSMRLLNRLLPAHGSLAKRLASTSSTSGIYESILDTIGNTPVVKASRVLPCDVRKRGVQLFAKLEYFNPLGSVKDRLALAMIEAAEREGALRKGQTVVEATSGNTGIGLAFVCAKKGYPFVACMAETYSIDRRKIMRALGAKVVVTPAALGGMGMVKKAQELAAAHGWCLAAQFENAANAPYHANTTGPEILRSFANRRLDYFVSGYGTGGTFTGVGMVMKAARPAVRIVLGEPMDAQLVSSGQPQDRNLDGSPSQPHPAFQPHMIQGWTPPFIPKVTQTGLDLSVVDEVVPVSDEEAVEMAFRLARREGIFTGISGGATAAVAVKVAEKAEDNAVVLTMIPDTQERYQSSVLWKNIGAAMNAEELQIMQSTPCGNEDEMAEQSKEKMKNEA